MIYDANLDELEIIIETDIRNDMPSDLDSLSTHTYIDSVYNIQLSSKEIKSNIAFLEGTGTVSVELQFGSDGDKKHGDGFTDTMDFNFSFQIEFDLAKKIVVHSDYNFDIEKYYE